MDDTERWVDEARQLLKAFTRTPRHDLLNALSHHAHKIDLARALCRLGCDQECSECSWGDLGGFPLGENCRLVAFLSGLKATCEEGRSPASLKPDAVALLDVLERSKGAN